MTTGTGFGGFTYNRIFDNVEQRLGGTGSEHRDDAGNVVGTEYGCRYYRVAELDKAKGFMGFLGALIKTFGTKVIINGETCIIGKVSFSEFKRRVKLAEDADFYAVTSQIAKQVGEGVIPSVQAIRPPSPSELKQSARRLDEALQAFAESEQEPKLHDGLLKIAEHPTEKNIATLDKDVHTLVAGTPGALQRVRTHLEALRGSPIDWDGTIGRMQRGCNEALQNASDKIKFAKDLKAASQGRLKLNEWQTEVVQVRNNG